MRILAETLGYAVAAGFLLLAVRAVYDLWVRRERRDAYLACAIGALAILALASQLELAYPPAASYGGVVALVSLMASAYALLLFRGTFIPLPRAAVVAGGMAVGATTVLGVFGQWFALSNEPFQAVVSFAPIAVWLVCAAEPSVRFWLAARRRPAVQRSRLRALSFGYMSIVLILVLSLTGEAGTGSASGLVIVTLMWTIALLVLPLLYMALWPPRWLRSLWRQGEERRFEGRSRVFSSPRPESRRPQPSSSGACGWWEPTPGHSWSMRCRSLRPESAMRTSVGWQPTSNLIPRPPEVSSSSEAKGCT
jgi:hypothetical protein